MRGGKRKAVLSRVNVIIPVAKSIPYLISKLRPVLKGAAGTTSHHLDNPHHHVHVVKSAPFLISVAYLIPPPFQSTASKHNPNLIPRGVLPGFSLRSYLGLVHVSRFWLTHFYLVGKQSGPVRRVGELKCKCRGKLFGAAILTPSTCEPPADIFLLKKGK